MSRRRRKERDRGPIAAAAPSSRLRLGALVAVVGVAVALAAISWRADSGGRATGTPAAARDESGPSVVTPAPSDETPRHYRPLLGEWRRPDGGYVLSVQVVSPEGSATVQYFNPRPIRVARAEARREEGLVGLFVEFDDVNYPGSTYTLGYDARSDQLRGVYYQAVQQAHFEVAFVRSR